MRDFWDDSYPKWVPVGEHPGRPRRRVDISGDGCACEDSDGRGDTQQPDAPPTAVESGVPQLPPGSPRIGELLLGSQALTPNQLAEALLRQSESGKRLGDLLLEAGLVSERDITSALAEQYKLPIVDLRTEAPDPDVAPLLSESLARSLCAVPMALDEDGAVRVAVGEPSKALIEEIQGALGRTVRPVLAAPTEIRRAIDNTYKALTGVEEQIEAYAASRGDVLTSATINAEVLSDDAPVVQVVQMIITQALRDRASDIHIEPQDDRVRVRYRIDGALHDVLRLPGVDGPGDRRAASRSWAG